MHPSKRATGDIIIVVMIVLVVMMVMLVLSVVVLMLLLLSFVPGLYMSVVFPIVMVVVSVVLPFVPFTTGTVMINTTVLVTMVAVNDASEGNSCISSARIVVICSTGKISSA